MEEEPQATVPDFKSWTARELFDHLIDLYIIPFEEDFEDWMYYKDELLQLCEESYEETI